jgi:hypothetical protein
MIGVVIIGEIITREITSEGEKTTGGIIMAGDMMIEILVIIAEIVVGEGTIILLEGMIAGKIIIGKTHEGGIITEWRITITSQMITIDECIIGVMV